MQREKDLRWGTGRVMPVLRNRQSTVLAAWPCLWQIVALPGAPRNAPATRPGEWGAKSRTPGPVRTRPHPLPLEVDMTTQSLIDLCCVIGILLLVAFIAILGQNLCGPRRDDR
jgi:hypothetical protein